MRRAWLGQRRNKVLSLAIPIILQAAGKTSLPADADTSSGVINPPESESWQVELTLSRALITGTLLGILLVLLQYPIARFATIAFSAGAELESLMLDYFYIRIYAAPATLITYSVIGALIGLQQMRAVLLVQLLLNLSNIILTVLFFMVFDAGVKGVALATVIAEYLSLAYGLTVVMRHTRLLPLRVSLSDILDPGEVRDLFMVNSNLLIRTLCLTFAFYWLTETSLQLGELVLAANIILIHMVHFSSHALDGFAHAAETLAGNAYGRTQKFPTGNAIASVNSEAQRVRVSAINDFRESVAVCSIWALHWGLELHA